MRDPRQKLITFLHETPVNLTVFEGELTELANLITEARDLAPDVVYQVSPWKYPSRTRILGPFWRQAAGMAREIVQDIGDEIRYRLPYALRGNKKLNSVPAKEAWNNCLATLQTTTAKAVALYKASESAALSLATDPQKEIKIPQATIDGFEDIRHDFREVQYEIENCLTADAIARGASLMAGRKDNPDFRAAVDKLQAFMKEQFEALNEETLHTTFTTAMELETYEKESAAHVRSNIKFIAGCATVALISGYSATKIDLTVAKYITGGLSGLFGLAAVGGYIDNKETKRKILALRRGEPLNDPPRVPVAKGAGSWNVAGNLTGAAGGFTVLYALVDLLKSAPGAKISPRMTIIGIALVAASQGAFAIGRRIQKSEAAAPADPAAE